MSEQEEVKRSFKVDIDVIRTHSYIIEDVNSQEEAEEVAEEWLEDGEEGTVANQEVFSVDSYPVEPEEDIVN